MAEYCEFISLGIDSILDTFHQTKLRLKTNCIYKHSTQYFNLNKKLIMKPILIANFMNIILELIHLNTHSQLQVVTMILLLNLLPSQMIQQIQIQFGEKCRRTAWFRAQQRCFTSNTNSKLSKNKADLLW